MLIATALLPVYEFVFSIWGSLPVDCMDNRELTPGLIFLPQRSQMPLDFDLNRYQARSNLVNYCQLYLGSIFLYSIVFQQHIPLNYRNDRIHGTEPEAVSVVT